MSKSGTRQFDLSNVAFLLIFGLIIAVFSSNKFEAGLFVLLVSFGLVIMEIIPENSKNEGESKILYFDLSVSKDQAAKSKFIAKCFGAMIVGTTVTSIPPIIKYLFLVS